MRSLILALAVSMILVTITGCDDKEVIIGCRMYDHVIVHSVNMEGLVTTDATMNLFIAASNYEELIAPVSFIFEEAGWLDDAVRIELHVYGLSAERTPAPFSDSVWIGDSLFVYYSGLPMNEDFLDCPSGAAATPPCEFPWYRVDYAIIYHPPGITVLAHGEPVGPHELCEQIKEH